MNWYKVSQGYPTTLPGKGTHSMPDISNPSQRPQTGFYIDHTTDTHDPKGNDCTDLFIWNLLGDKIDYKKHKKGVLGKLMNMVYDNPSTFSGYFDKCKKECLITPPHDAKKAREFNMSLLAYSLKQLFGNDIRFKMVSKHMAESEQWIKEASEMLKKAEKFDPNNPSFVPEGRYYAIKDVNDIIYYFEDADNHYEVIRRSKVPSSKIAATGWIEDGVFFAKPWGDVFQNKKI